MLCLSDAGEDLITMIPYFNRLYFLYLAPLSGQTSYMNMFTFGLKSKFWFFPWFRTCCGYYIYTYAVCMCMWDAPTKNTIIFIGVLKVSSFLKSQLGAQIRIRIRFIPKFVHTWRICHIVRAKIKVVQK